MDVQLSLAIVVGGVFSANLLTAYFVASILEARKHQEFSTMPTWATMGIVLPVVFALVCLIAVKLSG